MLDSRGIVARVSSGVGLRRKLRHDPSSWQFYDFARKLKENFNYQVELRCR
jgi:hypothetical protein